MNRRGWGTLHSYHPPHGRRTTHRELPRTVDLPNCCHYDRYYRQHAGPLVPSTPRLVPLGDICLGDTYPRRTSQQSQPRLSVSARRAGLSTGLGCPEHHQVVLNRGVVGIPPSGNPSCCALTPPLAAPHRGATRDSCC